MSPARKPHTKSRYGCVSCKRRHVKCDEQRPTCQNCTRRREHCTYSKSHSFGLTAPGATPCSASERLSTATTRQYELYLMHHYSTMAFATLASSSWDAEVWRTAIPNEGLKYEFLTDGILALSSLHLGCLEPALSLGLTETAVRYQNRGLCGFKESLNQITEDNLNALFAFSIIITILGLAMPNACPGGFLSKPVQSLTSMFQLLRGVGAIVQASKDIADIQCGMFSPLFYRPNHGPLESKLACPDGLEVAMAKLRCRAGTVAKYVGPDRHRVYLSGIDSLDAGFRDTASNQSLSIVVAWPVMVPEELVHLFQQRDPMAQLIWVHYGVLLLHVHDRWWGRNFGVRLVESLSDDLHSVDPEWTTWTGWARALAVRTAQESEAQ